MSEIILSQEYEREAYDPPIPVLNIGVSRPNIAVPSSLIQAIIDTGADGTLIPRDVLEQAGASFIDRAFLRGITGERRPVDLYLVTLHLGPLHVTGVRAVALSPGETAILGRDVLNRLNIALIGTAGITEVLKS